MKTAILTIKFSAALYCFGISLAAVMISNDSNIIPASIISGLAIVAGCVIMSNILNSKK